MGVAPVSTEAPSLLKSAVKAACPCSSARLTHTLAGSAEGADGSGGYERLHLGVVIVEAFFRLAPEHARLVARRA